MPPADGRSFQYGSLTAPSGQVVFEAGPLRGTSGNQLLVFTKWLLSAGFALQSWVREGASHRLTASPSQNSTAEAREGRGGLLQPGMGVPHRPGHGDISPTGLGWLAGQPLPPSAPLAQAPSASHWLQIQSWMSGLSWGSGNSRDLSPLTKRGAPEHTPRTHRVLPWGVLPLACWPLSR